MGGAWSLEPNFAECRVPGSACPHAECLQGPLLPLSLSLSLSRSLALSRTLGTRGTVLVCRVAARGKGVVSGVAVSFGPSRTAFAASSTATVRQFVAHSHISHVHICGTIVENIVEKIVEK